MKYIRNGVLVICLCLFALTPLFAQSRYLEDGIGGSSFNLLTVIDDSGLSSAGVSAAYSIGGIMDLGFSLCRQTGTLEDSDRTDWSFSFLYNLLIIKQSEYVPLSAQLEVAYGYANTSADYLDDNEYALEGQGFDFGLSAFYEFNFSEQFSGTLGLKGNYSNYFYSEINYQVPDSPELNSFDRIENLKMGGLAAVTCKAGGRLLLTLELELFYNQPDGDISIEPSLIIISQNL